jgi:peptidoglycan/LPS O-acetylase OafA/YrhL
MKENRALTALAILVVLCGSHALAVPEGPAAPDSAATTPTYCSPMLAGTLSVFLPGSGQMYAGETVKGVVLSTLWVGGIVSIATANIGSTHDSIRPGGWAAVIVTASTFIYAMIDAPFAANRWNDRYHLQEPPRTALRGTTPLVTFSFSL